MGKGDSNQATITGLQAFRGEGGPATRGFWADAWEHVLKQPAAVIGLVWVGVVAFFAIYAPLLCSGHPIAMWEIDRRTSADAAAWFTRELTTGATGSAVRERATVGTARQALKTELGRHAAPGGAVPTVESLLPAATTDAPDDRPLTLGEVQRLARELRASTGLDATGDELHLTSPMLGLLTAADWAILVFGTVGILLVGAPARLVGGLARGRRIGLTAAMGVQAAATLVLASYLRGYFMNPNAPAWARAAEDAPLFIPLASAACAVAAAALFALLPAVSPPRLRIGLAALAGLVTGVIVAGTWLTPPGSFDYLDRQRLGEIRAVYTLIPWSSNQRPSDRDAATLPPGTTHDQALANVVRSAVPSPGMRASTPEDVEAAVRAARALPLPSEVRDRVADDLERRFGGREGVTPAQVREAASEQLRGVGPVHLLGTDKFGQDVLAQILHACRLAISMGLVSTGLATLIGVTMGSLMGYFGGWVDLLLYRVVEMFMAIPVLFLLIVAAGVLERNTYVMMAIIGCVTWHSAARFTRAEFMKLRSQDFVQSAKAVGLPLPSILFKHMLPNGVTPVLVDASFGIAAAILFEAVLSYLGLGPPDQPSWGRVLADSSGEAGTFNWWLGVFPGAAIFLTVLSLTMVGENLRDAIDPKLKKARV